MPDVARRLFVGDLVLEDRIVPGGAVEVAGEKIVAIHEDRRRVDADDVVDLSGRLIMPGIVDSHIHARSTDDEGLGRATRAAAAGGVTTVIDMPFDRSGPITNSERFEAKVNAIEREAVVDVGLYAMMPRRDGVGRLRQLAELGACAFKFSMFEVDPERLPRIGNGDLLMAFEELAPIGVPIVIHAEDQEIVDSKTRGAEAADVDDWARHALSRPVVAETAAMAVVLEFAYWSGARLHLAHVTHPHGFEMLDFYASLGARVSGETCVQYLTLTNERAVAEFGTFAKINPPLRDGAARDGLWDALSEGRVASVSSDHAPWPRERKQTRMLKAASGMPGLETIVPALFTEARRRSVDWPYVAGFVTWRPAAIFGLGDRKGALRPGLDADLCVLDPTTEWRYDAARTRSIADHGPFDGTPFTGKVVATYLRGERVYADGAAEPPEGGGRWLRASHMPASTVVAS